MIRKTTIWLALITCLFIIPLASASTIYPQTAGLVLNLSMDDGSGTTITDTAGGAESFSVDVAGAWVTGVSGTAFNTTARGIYRNSASSTFFTSRTNFSFGGWFYFTDNTTAQELWGPRRELDGRISFSAGALDFYTFGGAVTSFTVPCCTKDAWHFIAVSLNGTHKLIVLDNTATTQAYADTPGAGGAYNHTISSGYTGNLPFKGAIDEIFFYSRSMSATDLLAITALHSSVVNTITASLSNLVNGSSIGSVTFSNVTGSLTFSYFNITGSGFCVTYTGNGTGTNCTAGNGGSTYYNVTNTTTITGTQSVSAATSQAIIEVQAYRLFLNTSIASFNGTNARVANTTASGTLRLYALNGSNNIKIDVAGNYSKNITCTVLTPLSTANCNATGIYDGIIAINATYWNRTAINSFSVTGTNISLGSTNGTTTGGSVNLSVIQGYTYTLVFDATNAALVNASQQSNQSINYYSFLVYETNTFNISIHDEQTNQIVTEAFTLELISDDYSNNYTLTGSTNITLLIPGAYELRYHSPNGSYNLTRSYFYTLTNRSYNTIRLYAIKDAISAYFIPVIYDQFGGLSSCTRIQLIRGYIEDNTLVGHVVEMADTDPSGQAVLRIEPNNIYYKFYMTGCDGVLSTNYFKVTSSTIGWQLQSTNSFLQSINTMGVGAVYNLTFNNATNTFSLNWLDGSNIVTGACLIIKKYLGSTITTVSNSCSDGSSGSIIYTVADTDQTTYHASATITTSTDYSTYSESLTISFKQDYLDWGIMGVFFTLVLTLVLVFAMGGSAAGSVIGGVSGIVIMGLIGVLAWEWTSVVGIIIVAGIIVYKLRS